MIAQRGNHWLRKLPLSTILLISWVIGSCHPAIAQPVSDSTLGVEGSQVSPDTLINGILSNRIDGGALRGVNLFHSFQEFNVGDGRGVYFSNPAGVQNILSRVTGSNRSEVLGTLGVLGNANLFLINPNGILFGANARLDMRGSFIGSTASSLQFADGTQFSASNPQGSITLTIAVPLGLQFGQTPGEITSQGASLTVQPNQTLALVGGNLTVNGGLLSADGGRVELGSVASNSRVALTPVSNGFALDYGTVQNFQNIQVAQQARIAANDPQGTVTIQAGQLMAQDGSTLSVSTFGSGDAGTLTVRAAESVKLSGANTTFFGQQASSSAQGRGGNINIETQRLTVQDGARLSVSTFGSGDAGTLTVRAAESVDLSGANTVLDGDTTQNAQGKGGVINIETQRLTIRDGARISTTTFGAGDAGNLTIRATESVNFSGTNTVLYNQTTQSSQGRGGDVNIETQRLTMGNGAQISLATFGTGNAGALTIRAAESVDLSGTNTVLYNQTTQTSQGQAGNLNIETQRLTIRDAAFISTSTFSTGNGGNIDIRAADSVSLSNQGSIFSTVGQNAQGKGGDISLTTRQLSIGNRSSIDTSTNGTGNAGNQLIRASELVDLAGSEPSVVLRRTITTTTTFTPTSTTTTTTTTVTPIFIPSTDVSGLAARAEQQDATGNAGNITVETAQLRIRNNARISTSTAGQGKAGDQIIRANSVDLETGALFSQVLEGGNAEGGDINIQTDTLNLRRGSVVSVSNFGTGRGGNLNITARDIFLGSERTKPEDAAFSRVGNLTATTASGDGGNITLNVTNLLLLLRFGSQISTTAGTANAGGNGGNITINAPFILAVPGENSDIRANAFTGNGGRVGISAQSIFGLRAQPADTPNSDITASSTLGLAGTVSIRLPNFDPIAAIDKTPVSPPPPPRYEIAQGCEAQKENPSGSSFTTQLQNALPINPVENPAQPSTSLPESSVPIVEAQGWVRHPNNPEVVFFSAHPSETFQTGSSCGDQ